MSYVIWWPILYNPTDLWCHTWYGGQSCTILRIYGVIHHMVANPVQSTNLWCVIRDTMADHVKSTDLWYVIRDMVADPVQSYRSMVCHTWYGRQSCTIHRSMVCHTWHGGRPFTILQIYGVSYVIWWPTLYNPIDHTWYGGRPFTIIQIYGVSYVIWWPTIYNPTDLWGVIRDMMADPLQSHRSMGCHTWYGGRSFTILQIYGIPYVIWWPTFYSPKDLWGVIRDMVADPVQSYRSMECHTWYGGRPFTILQIYRVHQDISTVEKRCQGKWSPTMLADNCWALRRKVPQARYSRKWSSVTFYILYRRWTK